MSQTHTTTTTTTEHNLNPQQHFTTNGGRNVSSATVLSHMSRTSERPGEQYVIGEHTQTTQNKVIKKKMVEEIKEKIIIVPETVMREEEYEEMETVMEKIVEVAVPTIREHFVEVPDIHYQENVIEVPETVVTERIVHVPKIEYQEVINYIPKIQTVEKVVEVPKVEYIEVVHRKTVEVPEYREEVIINEIPVPKYVDVPIERRVDVEVTEDIERNIPVPMEAITVVDYAYPSIEAQYEQVNVPFYVPRFIEVPVPEDMMSAAAVQHANDIRKRVEDLSNFNAFSLCTAEEIASMASELSKMMSNVAA